MRIGSSLPKPMRFADILICTLGYAELPRCCECCDTSVRDELTRGFRSPLSLCGDTARTAGVPVRFSLLLQLFRMEAATISVQKCRNVD